MRRLRATFLISLFCLQLLLPVATAYADHPGQRTVSTIGRGIEHKAGGWGIATPLMIAAVALYQEATDERDLEAKRLANRTVLGGLAGDFLMVAGARALVPMLPIPPVMKTALVISAGFLGWEVGSGNLAETDWVGLGAQIATATLLQTTLTAGAAAIGLSLGPVGLTALTIAGTIGVGMLVDKLRGPEADAWERPAAPTEAPPEDRAPEAPAAALSSRMASEDAWGPRPSRRDYSSLVAALESGDREALTQRYRSYQGGP